MELCEAHLRELWRSSDYTWRGLFERADVMSEGAIEETDGQRIYFGTTSVLLPAASRGGQVPDASLSALHRAASRDPHVRLRAIRIAAREATVRANAELMTLQAELIVRADPRGVRIDVDVAAAVAPASRLIDTTARR